MIKDIETQWKKELQLEIKKTYFKELERFVEAEYEDKCILPPKNLIFSAFNLCHYNDVKVVIIGQDPYHRIGQAHGLCFSVPNTIKTPPSLRNIFKEINSDIGAKRKNQNNLNYWAEQGVFMINAILTVEEGRAGSHQKKGWETFTDAVIELLANRNEHIVFILWGAYAQRKCEVIDEEKHLILKSVHPSPLSASRGFYGNNHFSKTNKYLIDHNIKPIDWQVDGDSTLWG